MNNLLIAQSGGPTAAINATMMGVIQRAVTSARVDKIYGALFGVKGIMNGQIKEIGNLFANPQNMTLLAGTPASALGTCRYKLPEDEGLYAQIIGKLRELGVGYFVYIGGNDSMDTVAKLSRYCKQMGITDIAVMGAPKTIDNDLCVTDHTPGFGTAAKYIAVTVAEIMCDIRVYDTPMVTIVEVMGRNAGWLTAASCLAGLNGSAAPHLIYIPEVAFDEGRFIEDVKEQMAKTPYVLVAVSEGVRDKAGKYICEYEQAKQADVFGHIYLSGVGKYLAGLVRSRCGCKVRDIELSLMQRCAAHIASASDIEESRMLGAAALDRAFMGASGEMSVIKRISTVPYQFKIETVPVDDVANHEKRVPLEWMNAKRNNVTQEMIDYLYPLIQGEVHVRYKNGIPEHIQLH